MRNMIIRLTKDDLERIIDRGNLTKNESTLLTYRNEEKSLEECAELMDYSVRTISTINKGLNNKIIEVIKK